MCQSGDDVRWPTLLWAVALSGRGKGLRSVVVSAAFIVVVIVALCIVHPFRLSECVCLRGQSLIFHEHSTFPFHKAEARVLFCSPSLRGTGKNLRKL